MIESATMASVTELEGSERAPVMFKVVPVALVKSKLAKVPTWIKLGKEVEADNDRNVLVA